MPRKKKEEETVDETPVEETEESTDSEDTVEETVEEKPEEEVSKKPVKEKDATEAVVTNNHSVIRAYSKELHGEDFVDLANEFCSQPGRENFVVELR